MREYLFRGKPTKDIHFYELNEHISKDEFVYGNLIVDGDVCYIVKGIVEATDEYINFERWIPVREDTVGQFTGLLDKNGTKIFEGDKLHLHYYLQNEQGETFWFDKYVEIKWVQDDVFYGFLGVDGCDYYSLENYSNKEVIGNIHDEGE